MEMHLTWAMTTSWRTMRVRLRMSMTKFQSTRQPKMSKLAKANKALMLGRKTKRAGRLSTLAATIRRFR